MHRDMNIKFSYRCHYCRLHANLPAFLKKKKECNGIIDFLIVKLKQFGHQT